MNHSKHLYCGVEVKDDDEVDEDHEVDDEYDDHDDLGDVDIYNCALVALFQLMAVGLLIDLSSRFQPQLVRQTIFEISQKSGQIDAGFMLGVMNSTLLCNSNSLFVQYLGLNLYKKLL